MLYVGNMDALALYGDILYIPGAALHDLEHDLAAGLALHPVGTLLRCLAVDTLAVYGNDAVARLKTGLDGRAVWIGLGDEHRFIRTLLDKGTHAAVDAGGHHLHVIFIFFRIIDRVGVQRREHRIDAGVYQFAKLHAVNIVGRELLEYRVLDVQGFCQIKIGALRRCGKGNHRQRDYRKYSFSHNVNFSPG